MGFTGAKKLVFAVLLVGFAAIRGPAAQAQNLVTNGNFSMPAGSTSFQFGTYGPYTPTETLTGWASPGGYNYVFLPSSTAATGFYGSLSLWSPVTGSANGFTNATPSGGNFVAADADYGTAPITQTINNLKPHETYLLSFVWAAAQQSGFDGATTDQWTVSLGSQNFSTAVVNLPNHGFSGWMNQSFYITNDTSTSSVLSFLAVGAPQLPPFTLLASVQLVDVPEPGTLAMLASALAGMIWLARRRGANPMTEMEQPV